MRFRFFSTLLLMSFGLSSCGPDYIASTLTGRDCNTAYLYDGDDFCAAPKGPPPPQPYCTTGFEGTDCWARPDLMPNVARQTAEGPTGLTPLQNRKRMNE
ncbi:hypothetical protein AA101099_0897 [Neoasaia chiangmaiensis NBRC 101099]|uniref:Uncharacterized protein n=1 Tax=Neoasaia chiangmaiensis TaxID=320497 RepID=A0A1U9KMJ2_9PROT|nr:hypothetical protein [Neoasaia chiangmaiensis]AQS87007.1 hypothetical protein A0U93_02560 [Neoasaia chiangmaiensis]GBR37812.1 hypothetical protein AA101099_0897 [Neoasaia chiangmaiensis NBRC 101099]GEN15135.1 hypothetical protein NCH01_15660 [Neoasaia chiangmaiensis]